MRKGPRPSKPGRVLPHLAPLCNTFLHTSDQTAHFFPFGDPNQYVSVDLFGGIVDGFEPHAGALENFFQGSHAENTLDVVPYTDYVFDVTALLAPGTYTLRFAEVDNQLVYDMSVDDVSLVVRLAAVPEPSTVLLVGSGLAALLGAARRRARG